MLIFVFVMIHRGTNTQKSYIYNEHWCVFQVTSRTITITNHMHNGNFCFCHVTLGTNTLKSYIQWKLMCFSSNELLEQPHLLIICITLIFVFVMIHRGTNTQKSYIYNENWCVFQVTSGTITITNHMHNPNFCFCHDTRRNKHTKIIHIQWKLMCFSSNVWNNHNH